ncbi:MAG: vitamin K epoxide reductase family protein [Agriterribacter sp.]
MKLITPLHNCEKTTIRLVRSHKVSITDTTIRTSLETHPDYPSLLSISDFLHNYNIENIALKTKVENFSAFSAPFIAHITLPRTKEKGFALVHAVRNNTILYEDTNKNKLIEEDISQFKQRFSGYALLVDSTEAISEKDFGRKQRQEKFKGIAETVAILFLPVIVLIQLVSLLIIQPPSVVIFPALFLLLSLTGTAISFLLLLFEIDNHNPLLKEICLGGKKVNCEAVIQSRASGIGGVSWSCIGFCYFSGILLMQLFTGITNRHTLSLLTLFNLLSLPYVFFSIYYQWKVVKQWCLLCLAVQAVLLLQLLISLGGAFHSLTFLTMSFAGFTQMLALFLLPALVFYITIPALKKSKEGKEHHNELQRFKNSSQVFDVLLGRQKKIQQATEGLGITLGNPNAPYRIIKVCNPYCGPCAKAHPVIEGLIEQNNDIQLQIIFTASGDDADFKTPPVRHFLAIASKNDESLTKQMLDDWYNAPAKDYTAFSKKYPVKNKDLLEQNEKIRAMNVWCEVQEISFTPTFFVNEFQLPDAYSIADLKYLLTD